MNDLKKGSKDPKEKSKSNFRRKVMNQEIVKALLEIGCKQINHKQFTYNGYPFKVYDSNTLSEVFKKLIDMGGTLKTWEVKSVLQIP